MLMLSTLLRPDGGTIRIDGHDTVHDTLSARRTLGWMPDTLGSWSGLTVRETLLAVCAMYGIRAAAATARVEELLRLADLETLAEQRTSVLSRGQKQRLSLARALAHRPSVLLLDEPASGLDPAARMAQRRMLTTLAAEGAAILVTSHVLDELDQLATNVVFLRDGRTAAPEAVTAALRRGQTWRIRAIDPGVLEAALTAASVEWSPARTLDGVVSLVQVADSSAAAALLATMVASGVRVIEFAPASSTLEHAFVELSEGTP
jgi:ABC-type multidrug transport system ATPase subunit